MSTFIENVTIKRLLRDVKQIIQNPLTDNGIYYCHDENDLTKGYAMIVGPSDTPYFGGFYFFKFSFPHDYPFTPPKVTFMTRDGKTRFNPNLYVNGKVCVSILNTWDGEQWSACQNINSILLTLCSLLTNKPLLNEPGFTSGSRDFKPYHKTIEYVNIDFAICDLLDKRLNKIPTPFETFYPFMVEHFYKNYDVILRNMQNMKVKQTTYTTNFYNMVANVDYTTLINKFIATKQALDTNAFEPDISQFDETLDELTKQDSSEDK